MQWIHESIKMNQRKIGVRNILGVHLFVFRNIFHHIWLKRYWFQGSMMSALPITLWTDASTDLFSRYIDVSVYSWYQVYCILSDTFFSEWLIFNVWFAQSDRDAEVWMIANLINREDLIIKNGSEKNTTSSE